MKNSKSKLFVMVVALAVVVLMLEGCSKPASTGSLQEPYFVVLSKLEYVDKGGATDNSKHISSILFGENNTLTVTTTSANGNQGGGGGPITYQLSSDAYDAECTFVFDNDTYVIKPKIINEKTHKVELYMFKNNDDVQVMSRSAA